MTNKAFRYVTLSIAKKGWYGEMTGVEYDICRTQERIYEEMAKQGYEMESFSDAYLSSDFCNREMDAQYSHFQLEDFGTCSCFFMPQIEDKLKMLPDDYMFNLDVAAWIGFTYRQLNIVTGTPSAELVKIIPFEMMCACYAGLHTIDEDMAVERLIEAHQDVLKKREN